MPKSKSKSIVPAASSGVLPKHPAVAGEFHPYILAHSGALEGAARYPDEFGDPTAATVLKNDVTLTADAAGTIVFGVGNMLGTNSHFIVPVTGGAMPGVMAGGAIHPTYGAFTSEARYARQVAVSITVTYIGRADAAAGYMTAHRVSDLNDILSVTVDSLQTGSQFSCRGDAGIKFSAGPMQHPRWESPAAAGFGTATNPIVVFAATGLEPSKVAYRMTITRHMEFIPKEGTLSEHEVAVEPNDHVTRNAAAALTPSHIAFRDPADKNYWNRLKQALNASYHIAAPIMKPWVLNAARHYLQNASRHATQYGGGYNTNRLH